MNNKRALEPVKKLNRSENCEPNRFLFLWAGESLKRRVTKNHLVVAHNANCQKDGKIPLYRVYVVICFCSYKRTKIWLFLKLLMQQTGILEKVLFSYTIDTLLYQVFNTKFKLFLRKSIQCNSLNTNMQYSTQHIAPICCNLAFIWPIWWHNGCYVP